MPLLGTRGSASSRGFGRFGGSDGLFAFTSFTFTPAGASSATGPSLAQLQSAYAGNAVLTGLALGGSQGIQQLVIPKTGNYRFTAKGAGGGASLNTDAYSTYSGYSPDLSGGQGATGIGTIALTQGEYICMAVGQCGTAAMWGSGGGGTFVSRGSAVNGTILMAIGGGAGNSTLAKSGYEGATSGAVEGGYKCDANAGQAGNGGYDGSANTSYGYGGANNGAAAGYYGNSSSQQGTAQAYVNGAAGSPGGALAGGFGGGGGSGNSGSPSGSGGGYTGGNGTTNGGTGGGITGGGGSYINTSQMSSTSTARYGTSGGQNGSILVEFLV
jgi:hypothetical protein